MKRLKFLSSINLSSFCSFLVVMLKLKCNVWYEFKNIQTQVQKKQKRVSRFRNIENQALICYLLDWVYDVLCVGSMRRYFCSFLSTTCSKSLILAIVSQLLFKFMKHGTYFECIIHDARMLLGCYDILYTRIFYQNVRVKWRSFGFSKQWCTSRKKYGRKRGMSWLFSEENTPNFVHLEFQGLCYEIYLSTHTNIF